MDFLDTMKIGESKYYDMRDGEGYDITRIPQGWLYKQIGTGHVVFVPNVLSVYVEGTVITSS